MRSRVLTTTAAIAAGATALVYRAYRKDIKAARKWIETGSQIIHSAGGPIEFAESGDGPAVLVVHGAGGGFDQGLDVGRAFVGDGYRIVAPSRFGYLGTPLPDDASAEAQADAHARLLDALKLDRVPVAGISAGAPSAMQFCLRHPDRCSALVLLVPLAYTPRPARRNEVGMILNAVASSDFLFWTAMRVAHPTMMRTILGTPVEDYRAATKEVRRQADEMMRSILPISRRAAGLFNDAEIGSNLERYALEDIRVPTIVISAADCLYGTCESGLYTAAHIHDAKFVAFPAGGHLLLGHDAEVRAEITRLLKESMKREAAVTV